MMAHVNTYDTNVNVNVVLNGSYIFLTHLSSMPLCKKVNRHLMHLQWKPKWMYDFFVYVLTNLFILITLTVDFGMCFLVTGELGKNPHGNFSFVSIF